MIKMHYAKRAHKEAKKSLARLKSPKYKSTHRTKLDKEITSEQIRLEQSRLDNLDRLFGKEINA